MQAKTEGTQRLDGPNNRSNRVARWRGTYTNFSSMDGAFKPETSSSILGNEADLINALS